MEEMKDNKTWYCVAHCYESTDADDAHRHQRHSNSLCEWEFFSHNQISPFGASTYDLMLENI